MTLNSEAAIRPKPAVFAPPRRPGVVRFAMMAVAIFSAFGVLVSSAPTAVLAGAVTFTALIVLLWRPREVPILLFPAVYQWAQVAVKPILTVVYDKPIDRVLDLGFRLENGSETAALFGFAGVACLGLGMWLGARGLRVNANVALRMEAQRWSARSVFGLTVGAIILGHGANSLSTLAGPALQLVLAFAGLEYAGIFVLAYWCFITRRGYPILVAVTAIEIVMGFTGFFADFRGPVLMLALAALMARPSFRLSSVATMAFLAAVILSLAVFWSEVKVDYRTFASGGTGGQVVVQPIEARLGYIYEAARKFDGDKFADGFNKLLARFSYIDFLGATLANVPRFLPHEGGKLVGGALANVLMPRVLFPDKPALVSDTEITGRYAGVDIRNAADTSISIGWLGELYIDFDYFGALLATTVIGVFIGFFFRVLRDYDGGPRLVSYGICTMLTLPVLGFETSLTKFIDGALLAFGAGWLVQRVIAPRLLGRFLPQFYRNGRRKPLRVRLK